MCDKRGALIYISLYKTPSIKMQQSKKCDIAIWLTRLLLPPPQNIKNLKSCNQIYCWHKLLIQIAWQNLINQKGNQIAYKSNCFNHRTHVSWCQMRRPPKHTFMVTNNCLAEFQNRHLLERLEIEVI